MKTFLKIVGFILLISFVIIPIMNKMLKKSIDSKLENLQITAKLEVQDAVNIMASQLPIKVGSNTTLTKLEYLEKVSSLIYYYEITGVNKDDMDAITSNLKSEQLQVIKNSKNNKAFIKAKVSFLYIYSDPSGVELGSFSILPYEY